MERRRGITFVLMRLLCGFLSILYSAAIVFRKTIYRLGLMPTHHLEARVISVGNISLGGTGKTPLVQLLAGELEKRDRRVAVLTRGYGRSGAGPRVLWAGRGHWRDVGDEPLMLSRRLPKIPIVVGADRLATGQLALGKYQSQCLILDDGLQHLRLARDVDIIVIDATMPFGNGKIFPAGTLREDIKGLKRADLFFLTRVDQAECPDHLIDVLKKINPLAGVVQSAYRPFDLRDVRSSEIMELGALKRAPVLALSGIGNPRSFESLLERLGADLAAKMRFPDHHPYDRSDMVQIGQHASEIGCEYIITTEKDAVRLIDVGESPVPLLALGIRLEVIDGREMLWRIVLGGS